MRSATRPRELNCACRGRGFGTSHKESSSVKFVKVTSAVMKPEVQCLGGGRGSKVATLRAPTGGSVARVRPRNSEIKSWWAIEGAVKSFFGSRSRTGGSLSQGFFLAFRDFAGSIRRAVGIRVSDQCLLRASSIDTRIYFPLAGGGQMSGAFQSRAGGPAPHHAFFPSFRNLYLGPGAVRSPGPFDLGPGVQAKNSGARFSRNNFFKISPRSENCREIRGGGGSRWPS